MMEQAKPRWRLLLAQLGRTLRLVASGGLGSGELTRQTSTQRRQLGRWSGWTRNAATPSRTSGADTHLRL
jgi:hypothetical protein